MVILECSQKLLITLITVNQLVQYFVCHEICSRPCHLLFLDHRLRNESCLARIYHFLIICLILASFRFLPLVLFDLLLSVVFDSLL
jgi:hypothetical protein